MGGYFDEEFKEATIALFQRHIDDEVVFVISDLLELELINAPRKVRGLLDNYNEDKFERIEITEETINLANTYIKEKIVGKTCLEDCRHIALATINRLTF